MCDMDSSSWAGLITAIATVVTACGGLVIAISVLIPSMRTAQRTEELSIRAGEQLQIVHTIVNQQKTDAQRYNIALTEMLKKHGIDVPIDQSLPVIGEADAQPGQPT